MKYSISLSCVLFVAACATSDDDAMGTDLASTAGEDGSGEADSTDVSAPDMSEAVQGASGGFAIPEPTLSTGGSSRVSVPASASAAGPALALEGGREVAAYAIASYVIDTGAMRATGSFTVNPAAGASFTYALRGTGGGYTSRYLRIQRVPGSDALQAVSANGPVVCGTLASGRPTAVALAFDGATRTFDVRIAGAPTACTGLPTKASGPIIGLRVTDEAIEGYGGRVDFTDIALSGSP